MYPELGLLPQLSNVLPDAAAGVDRTLPSGIRIPRISGLDTIIRLSIYRLLLEAAERGIVFSDKTILFLTSFNSIYMRKVFLLALTAVLLAGPAAFANGGGKAKAKQQDCTHCTKQNCTGTKCAQCCAHGKCTKG